MGKLLEHLYFSHTSGILGQLRINIENTKEDILIFGSSRASHHYNSLTLASETHLSTYNLGQDGQGMYMNYALLKIILERYQPKMIILDLNLNEFTSEKKRYDRVSRLLPYYKRYDAVKEVVELRSDFEKLKMLSFIYPYNSMLLKLLFGRTETQTLSYNGYIPLTESKNPKPETPNPKPETRNPKQQTDHSILNYSVKFLNLIKERNIKCYVFTSPHFTNEKIFSRSVSMIDSICDSMGIKYIDLSFTKGISDNSEYFRDVHHLNSKGAEVYTKMIAGMIRGQ